MSHGQPTVQKFDRYSPAMMRSFSLRTFNNCETEINEHFWSFKVMSDHARYLAAAQNRIDGSVLTRTLFSATGPDADRIPRTVSQWLDARDELENWLRLSALVSAASYFEAYLRQIARSALMSDPFCRLGATRKIDGLILLKKHIEWPFEQELEQLTKGEWNSRIAAFVRIFGKNPNISAFTSDLEKIRKIRNAFAHGFGRDLTVPYPSEVHMQPSYRLSQRTFIKYIASLSKSAAYIDKCLLTYFIGNFELLQFFHSWRTLDRNVLDKKYDEHRAFKRTLHRDLSVAVTQKFCTDLIAYYNSL